MTPQEQNELIKKLAKEQGLKPPKVADQKKCNPFLFGPVLKTPAGIFVIAEWNEPTITTTSTPPHFPTCTIQSLLYTQEVISTWNKLPEEFCNYRLAELLTIAGGCFERSIANFARFHGLPRKAKSATVAN